MPVLLWGLLLYHLFYAVAVVALLIESGGAAAHPATLCAAVLPAGLALAAGLMLLGGRIADGMPRWTVALSQALCAAVFFVLLPGLPSFRGLVPFFVGLGFIDLLGLKLAERRPLSTKAAGAGGGVLLALVFLLPVPFADRPGPANELGLFSGPPNVEETLRDQPSKDDYPPCHFRYNSLGWRDEEPSLEQDGRFRILLIGDSFVWGDGVPSNEQTLPQRLRERLEERLPGRTRVLSAAAPGLDLYGYSRYVSALLPVWKPDLIVVSYLGEPDLNLLDAQGLVELIPENRFVAGLIEHHRVLQHIHESRLRRSLHDPKRHLDRYQALLNSMVPKNGDAHELALLDYSNEQPWSLDKSGLLHWHVPAEWRYEGRSTDLWYAKDYHPRPKLLELIADWMARKVVDLREPVASETGRDEADSRG